VSHLIGNRASFLCTNAPMVRIPSEERKMRTYGEKDRLLQTLCLWRMSDGSRSKNDLNVKEIVTFGSEGSAAVKSMLGRCWNECANARDYLCLACRHTEPDWL
jgi:hypothetical protein